MSKNEKNDPVNPFDGPTIDIHSEQFRKKVYALMFNKHNNPDEDFNLFQNSQFDK